MREILSSEGGPPAPMGEIDLRRARDPRFCDRVVARAKWLPEPDRTRVLAVFRDGVSVAALARAGDPASDGHDDASDARIMRRRIAKAVARVLDGRAEFVATRLEAWPATRAAVAREIFLNGCSLREAARRCGTSLYAVRVHRDAVEGMYETEFALRAAQRGRIDRSWR